MRTIPNEPGLGHSVQQVWAAIVEHGPEDEAIAGKIIPGWGMTALVVGKPALLGKLTATARELAIASGKRVRVVCFSKREVLESFEP
jgi:hypothetical protein